MPGQPSRAGATAQRIEDCERAGELRHTMKQRLPLSVHFTARQRFNNPAIRVQHVVVKAEDSTCVDSVLNKGMFQCKVRRSQVKYEA
jgi:hypothetical protein